MPAAEYSFVLAGKYSVGKSSIFKRLKTGRVPHDVVQGTSRSTLTWENDDEGLDSFVYQREVAGKRIKVINCICMVKLVPLPPTTILSHR